MNEYTFEVNDKEYQAKFTIGALVKLEEWTGKGIAMLADEDKFGINTIIDLLRAALYHKNKGITKQVAMNIYEEFVDAGGDRKELFNELIQLYSKSVKNYMPIDEDDSGND